MNVIAKAHIQGVSTWKVDELVRRLEIDGRDNSTVSRPAVTLEDDAR